VVKHRSNIASLLNSSGVTQTANHHIEELLSEIEQLKADNLDKSTLEQQIEELRLQLKEQGGEKRVSIDLIVPNPNQPRQTFTEIDINELAQSLERYGQLEPVILIPQDDETYFIFDGERRWRSARQNLWTELNAVFIPALEEKDLHRKALITTLCRQDLNALDRAEAVLHEIELETKISPLESVNLIRSCIFRLDRQKTTKKLIENLGKSQYDFSGLELSDLEIAVMKVLLELSLNPSSFAALDLKALGLFDDLKVAIRTQGLPIKHSFTLSRLSAKNLKVTEAIAKRKRKKAIAHVLENNLTTSETTAYVNSLLSELDNDDGEILHHKQKSFHRATRKILNDLSDPDLTVETLSTLEVEVKRILETIQEKIANRGAEL
jgi:ParB family chromosome partitioning protein